MSAKLIERCACATPVPLEITEEQYDGLWVDEPLATHELIVCERCCNVIAITASLQGRTTTRNVEVP